MIARWAVLLSDAYVLSVKVRRNGALIKVVRTVLLLFRLCYFTKGAWLEDQFTILSWNCGDDILR